MKEEKEEYKFPVHPSVMCPKKRETREIEGACVDVDGTGMYKLKCEHCICVYGNKRENVTDIFCKYPEISHSPRI